MSENASEERPKVQLYTFVVDGEEHFRHGTLEACLGLIRQWGHMDGVRYEMIPYTEGDRLPIGRLHPSVAGRIRTALDSAYQESAPHARVRTEDLADVSAFLQRLTW